MSTFMFANSSILTDHNISDAVLEIAKNTFRSSEVKMASHARVYMWLFIALTVLWFVMRLFIYPVIRLFLKCCKDCEKRW